MSRSDREYKRCVNKIRKAVEKQERKEQERKRQIEKPPEIINIPLVMLIVFSSMLIIGGIMAFLTIH